MIVLVVDDNPDWCMKLQAILEEDGFSVLTAQSNQEARTILSEQSPLVAVLDLKLDESDLSKDEGFALLEEVHSLGLSKTIHSIVLTGYGTYKYVRAAFAKYGVVDFFEKNRFDLQVDEFLEAVRVAAAKAPHHPLLAAWDSASTSLDLSELEFSVSVSRVAKHIENVLGLPPYPSTRVSTYQRLSAVILNVSEAFSHNLLPDALPLMFLRRSRLLQEDLDHMRDLLAKQLDILSHIALLALFCEESDLQCVRQLLDKVHQTYAYDILPLSRSDLLQIIVAKDRQQALQEFVTSRVDLVTISPFSITGPASDNMFFGREKELREITEHAATVSYAIVGGRRIGKTSILVQLHRLRLPAVGFRVFYYQCQRLSDSEPTHQQFLEALSREWLDLTDFTPSSFSEILVRLSGDYPLVFLFDEVDRLIPADQAEGWPLFGELRALAESGHCQFVFAGERTLREAIKKGTSPLFNFANTMSLGRLDSPAVEELVTRPMGQLGIRLTEQASIVQRIWDFTSGHPNVVQRLCHQLIVRLNERQDRCLMPGDVEAVVEDPTFQRDDFYDVYLEQATVLERILPLVLAQDGDEPYTLSDVCRLLDRRLHLVDHSAKKPRAAEVDAALRRLAILRSILDYTSNGYVFAIKAFPRVIARWGQVTIADELMILMEKYRDYGDLTEDEIEQREYG